MDHILRIYGDYFPHHMEFYLCDAQFFDENPLRTEREIKERCRLVRTFDRNALDRLISSIAQKELGYGSFHFEAPDLFPNLNLRSMDPSPELVAATSHCYRIVAFFRKNQNEAHIQFSPEVCVRASENGVIQLRPSHVGIRDDDIASIVRRLHAFESTSADQHRLAYEIQGTEDIETLKMLLPLANIGKAAILNACERNDPVLVRLLLESGVDVNGAYEGDTALNYCSEKGFVDIMEILYEFGANVNLASRALKCHVGQSPLQTAARHNQLGAVQFLIKHGADVNHHDNYDWTPLLHAVAAPIPNVEIVRLLIASGAQVDVATNYYEVTPLMTASSRGLLDIVKLLLNNGAVNHQDSDGMSALYRACENGHLSSVTALLDHGANPNLLAMTGNTPRMIAESKGHLQIVQELISRGADNSPKLVGNDERLEQIGDGGYLQQTEMNGALIYAAQRNSTEVVQVLLDRGADVRHADTHGETALFHAVRNNNWPLAHTLLIHGASLNHLNSDGDSVLDVAAKLFGSQSDIYRLLLAYLSILLRSSPN